MPNGTLKVLQALQRLAALLTLLGEFLGKVSSSGISANLAERIRRDPGYRDQSQESSNPQGVEDEEPESDSTVAPEQGDLFETTQQGRPL